MWGAAHESHARFYYTLEALGQAESAASRRCSTRSTSAATTWSPTTMRRAQRMQLAFAKANGISEADFNREYNGFAVNTKLQRAEEAHQALPRRRRAAGRHQRQVRDRRRHGRRPEPADPADQRPRGVRKAPLIEPRADRLLPHARRPQAPGARGGGAASRRGRLARPARTHARVKSASSRRASASRCRRARK